MSRRTAERRKAYTGGKQLLADFAKYAPFQPAVVCTVPYCRPSPDTFPVRRHMAATTHKLYKLRQDILQKKAYTNTYSTSRCGRGKETGTGGPGKL